MLRYRRPQLVIWGISAKTDVVASATTIEIPLEHDSVSISGTTNIDNIDDTTGNGSSSYEQRQVTLLFEGILTVGDGAGNLQLAGAFTTAANDTLTLVYRQGTWREIG